MDRGGDGGVPIRPVEPTCRSTRCSPEYLSKIVFALELVGRDRPAAEAVRAKELATLRLEPWEVAAARRDHGGPVAAKVRSPASVTACGSTGQRSECARRGGARDRPPPEGLRPTRRPPRAGNQSLQRAAEIERRFQWFIDDALYRGDTEFLLDLYRSSFRLLRAYSGLWLVHNERGGTSPF